MQRKPWPIQEMIQWYQSGMSLQEIADRLSSEEWQAYWIEKSGGEYRPHQKIVNKCLNRHIQLRGRGAPAERNGFWRGGETTDKDGYKLIHSPDHPMATVAGYVREHRLIAEKHLGRYLTETEIVHHKDENPANNNPDNLMVYETNAQHIRETTKGKDGKPYQESGRIRWELTRNKPLSDRRDNLLKKLHATDRLSLFQIAGLLELKDTTVSNRLTLIGLESRHAVSGIVTDEIREECRQFLAIQSKSVADAQALPKSPRRKKA